MSRTPRFDDLFRSHLPRAQRRAVLEVIAHDLEPGTTIGEVIDAAESLGWVDALGTFDLGDLAVALAPGEASTTSARSPASSAPEPPPPERIASATVEDADTEPPEIEAAPEPEPAPAPAQPSAATSTKAATKKAVTPAKNAAAKKNPAAKAPAAKAPTAKTPAAKAPAAKAADTEQASLDDEALSLEQAAKILVPMIRRLKQATMQELEEETGMGRRKLRFHIGQLVKHEHLVRHGMGRGTYYTAVGKR